jgi:hypothetical protein
MREGYRCQRDEGIFPWNSGLAAKDQVGHS